LLNRNSELMVIRLNHFNHQQQQLEGRSANSVKSVGCLYSEQQWISFDKESTMVWRMNYCH
jgi:hypothetical protein